MARIALIVLLLGIIAGAAQVATVVAQRSPWAKPTTSIVISGLPLSVPRQQEISERLWKRVEHLSMVESWTMAGAAVTIGMPDASEAELERAKWLLTAPGHFDLMLVARDQSVAHKQAIQDGEVEGQRLVWPMEGDGEERLEDAVIVLTDDEAAVIDLRFDRCDLDFDADYPRIGARLAPSDAKLVGRLTRVHLERRLALIFDDHLVFAATIKAELARDVVFDVELDPRLLDDIIAIGNAGPHEKALRLSATITRGH